MKLVEYTLFTFAYFVFIYLTESKFLSYSLFCFDCSKLFTC